MSDQEVKLSLRPVRKQEREILARLLELYEYDFSAYSGEDVNEYGLYGYDYLDYYWTEDDRSAWFIEVNGHLAGFVMVCGFCYVSKEKSTHFMSEFFVLQKYRRQGVGLFAAKEVLKRLRGPWELTVHPKNPASHAFWQRVIAETATEPPRVIENVEGVYDDAPATAFLFTT